MDDEQVPLRAQLQVDHRGKPARIRTYTTNADQQDDPSRPGQLLNPHAGAEDLQLKDLRGGDKHPHHQLKRQRGE